MLNWKVHLRRSDACNKTLNEKDETQVNIKDLDAAIMFPINLMNEQTENNKQTNCFLKIFIRKPISSEYVSASKIG